LAIPFNTSSLAGASPRNSGHADALGH
jgi:hypothetical protein